MLTRLEVARGLADLSEGFRLVRVWWRLALMTSREQYKRSVLGPIWNTIGILALVLLFGLLYATMFGQDTRDHLPYVAAGLVLWVVYSELIIKSCSVFPAHAVYIQQMTLPKSVYIFRLIASELLSFGYAFCLIILPAILWGYGPVFKLVPALLGLLLIIVNMFSVSLILSVISLRYRDVAPIVANIMRPVMFLTPIIWNADSFPDRAIFIVWNPFYHIIEIFRAPMLGKSAALTSYGFVIAITLASLAMSLYVYSRYRARIAYWV